MEGHEGEAAVDQVLAAADLEKGTSDCEVRSGHRTQVFASHPFARIAGEVEAEMSFVGRVRRPDDAIPGEGDMEDARGARTDASREPLEARSVLRAVRLYEGEYAQHQRKTLGDRCRERATVRRELKLDPRARFRNERAFIPARA